MNIYGHEEIKSDLQLLLQQKKLPHALLFSGIEGIGKLLIAKQLAKSLLCKEQDIACDNCLSCKLFAEKTHPDFYFVEPEGKAKPLIKIEQIRNMQASIALSPYLSDKRVVIINDAQYLNDAAANSLLKTLEEPVGDVFFILLTANKEMLLPTILSRCMKIYFAPLKSDDVAKILQKELEVDSKKAHVIARLSGGSVKKAMQFVDDNALMLREKAQMVLVKNFDVRQMWSFVDEISGLDKVQVLEVINHLQLLIRDLLIINVNKNSEIIYNQDILEELIMENKQYSKDMLLAKMILVEDVIKKLNSNADVKLILQKFMLDWQKR